MRFCSARINIEKRLPFYTGVKNAISGGLITAYAWDGLGGGLPMEPLHAILRKRGIPYALPPSK